MSPEDEAVLKSPYLEILRDSYQTMNRRLEHYRQLAAGTIFGTAALFLLINNSIVQWQNGLPSVRPASWVDRLLLCEGLFVSFLLVIVIVFFALSLIKRSNQNFREVSSIILKIEQLFKVHEVGVFIRNDSLFPQEWPHLTPQGIQPSKWVEDIIPLTRNMIWTVAIIFTIYFAYHALRFVLP